jgi:hypothetical protein
MPSMPAALLLVTSPILHPVPAAAGNVLAWFVADRLEVWARRGGAWAVVRVLPHDNAGALAGLLADEIIEPVSPAHDARVRAALRSSLPAPARQQA